jgi:N-acetylmuramoyl-L-alanine amidase
MINVYISASTQKENVGVGQYGTEQDRMMQLSDAIKYYLDKQGVFQVFRNQLGWSLDQTVSDCNAKACKLFIDNHTNAGDPSASGTEDYYYGQGGTTSDSYKIASLVYNHIAPLSPGRDRGIMPDTNLYKSGLYVVQRTDPPATLVEHIFHTNANEVTHFLTYMTKYAKAEAQAVCEFFGVQFKDPDICPPQDDPIAHMINEMLHDGLITDGVYWGKVLRGELPVNLDYLKIIFARATDKI